MVGDVGLLYTDAGWSPEGDIWAGVTDAAGGLLDIQQVTIAAGLTDLGELTAVDMACVYATAACGVILTDSLTTVKAVGRARGYTRVPRSRDYNLIRDSIRAKLPPEWRVAWVPRELNLAGRALSADLRAKARVR